MQLVKNQTMLAKAFVRMLSLRPALRARARLVMVGDGPLRAECLEILRLGEVESLAWLPGERNDVADVMRVARLLRPALARRGHLQYHPRGDGDSAAGDRHRRGRQR